MHGYNTEWVLNLAYQKYKERNEKRAQAVRWEDEMMFV